LIPPAGFKAEMYPLHHRLNYACLLDLLVATKNSCMITLVKNYKAANLPQTIKVNPHDDSFLVETGAICGPMSIIDKLRMSLTISMTEASQFTDHMQSIKGFWRPIFFSFPEKLDAADLKTTTTVASILSLTKDATQEDITPAHSTKLATSTSTANFPASTANFTEVFGTMNLTTNVAPEGVPHNETTFQSALRYYTNKGALRACVGGTRYFTLTQNRPSYHTNIRKFVPSAVRRIVPYSFFGILIHIPVMGDPEQVIQAPDPSATAGHIGVTCLINYDEWNPEHVQLVDNS